MAAQKLNLLHILLMASALACLYYAWWESRQRTITLQRNFWASSWFAIITGLFLIFFQAGMKQSVWPAWAALAAGLVVGGIHGLTFKLRVDRSWSIPRPAGRRHVVVFAILLVAAVIVEIVGAAIGPEARIWRVYTALAAEGFAGILAGSAIALALRIWRLIG